MKDRECKPSYEKCIINKCSYFNLYKEIVHGELHIRIRCKENDIQIPHDIPIIYEIYNTKDEKE